MASWWRTRALLVGVWGCWAVLGCTNVHQPPASGEVPGETPSGPDASGNHPPQGGPDGGTRQDEPPPDAFRPAFHQTLSGSTQVAQRTTYRFRIPVGRAGTRLRFRFQAGEGPLKLHQATVARADAGGALASAPVALSFQGSPGANAQAHGVLRSDPVLLPVDFRQELAISFEVEGAVATGGADLFPQSYVAAGSFSQSMQGFGQPQARLVGLSTVEVEGEPGRCVAVVGAGSGVGGASGDVRETWPEVAERLLGMPVLDLSGDLEEKGQGLALLRQCREVACVVLPGAEEVAGHSAQELQASLSSIFTQLRPVCDVYAGTLPPSMGTAATRRAVNDWVKAQLPAGRVIDFARAVDDAEAASVPARMGNEVALGLKGSPVSELGGALSLEVTYQDSEHEIMAMDPDGTVYALKVGDSRGRLWASTDNARSWAVRGTHPGEGGFLKMTSLKDGTLLATVYTPQGFVLSRSTDHGSTWEVVLPLGRFRMLQPHSVRELHGTVFFLEYQTFTDTSPIRLWVSTDQGATWRVRSTVQGRRHGHSLVADPEQGVLWAMMGDLHGGLLRSVDEGVTWRPVVDGPSGVAVDGVVTPRGLLWGSDNLYGPPAAGIRRVAREDSMAEVAGLPGPSYSILHLPEGGYVLGTTRETGGDVYAAGDVSAHVLYSADGTTWKDYRDFPRLSEDDYVRADVYWQLPSGELVLELINSKELGPAGYMLLRAVRK